jgi:hypothetical protein
LRRSSENPDNGSASHDGTRALRSVGCVMSAGRYARAGAGSSNLISLIQAAGWPVWFLIVASVAAVALIVERFLSLKRDKVLPPRLLDPGAGSHVTINVLPKALTVLVPEPADQRV